MILLKILFASIFITIALGDDSEDYDAEELCEGLTRGLNFMFCSSNHRWNKTCDGSLMVDFYYYNKKLDEVKLGKKNWNILNPNQRTTIIVHGYLASRKATWISKMVEGLYKWNPKMNVIVVEWFKHVNYYTAAKAVDEVSTETVRMVREGLLKDTKIKKKYIHIIGHSLGAHIAGLTASKLRGFKIDVDRVTGLDPAKPLFDDIKNQAYKLNKTSARFVDVIHTNSNPKKATLGLHHPVGHLDFYPNGGDWQPGCALLASFQGRSFGDLESCYEEFESGTSRVPKLFTSFKDKLLSGHNMICDHEIAAEYFIESLRSRKFFGVKQENHTKISPDEYKRKKLNCAVKKNCLSDENCAEMGINAAKYRRNHTGVYLVKSDCSPAKPVNLISMFSNYIKLPTIEEVKQFFTVDEKVVDYFYDWVKSAASTLFGDDDDDDDDDD